jgi:hypothetical protein
MHEGIQIWICIPRVNVAPFLDKEGNVSQLGNQMAKHEKFGGFGNWRSHGLYLQVVLSCADSDKGQWTRNCEYITIMRETRRRHSSAFSSFAGLFGKQDVSKTSPWAVNTARAWKGSLARYQIPDTAVKEEAD